VTADGTGAADDRSAVPGIKPGDSIRGDWTLDQYVSAHGMLAATSTLRHITQWTPPALPPLAHTLVTPEVDHG
jgi:hypothetical protein